MKKKLQAILLSLLCAACLAPSGAGAQSKGDTYAIRNAKIVTVTKGVIENGTVVISGGKITAVGASVSIPGGAKIIDGRGLSVYPGLIDSGTTIGLGEVGQGAPGTVDTSEIGDNNANIHVDVAVLPDSSHIGVARVNGITTVLTMPRGGLIAGQSAIINLDGWTWPEMMLKSRAAMHINWPGGLGGGFEFGGGQARSSTELRREQDRQIENLKKILRDARAYADAKAAVEKDSALPRQETDLRKEGLIPVVRGLMPVIIHAQIERDIKKAIEFADEMKIKAIISGAVEAWRVAEQLKAKNIPVLLGPIYRNPVREDDGYDAVFTNAALLHKAGVRFAFQTMQSAEARDLPYHAGFCAAFGLPKEEALKAVTINAAEILGVADQVGSIEAGKMANLIVTDGDPLEIRTQIKHLFIKGRQVPLSSKHTELYEKYKARP
jgi:imidazolonepropionase-like amidohydrolase